MISLSRKLRIQFSSWKIKGNLTLPAFPHITTILFPHVPKITEARLVALKFRIRLMSFSVLCPGLFIVAFWSHSTSSAWQELVSLFFYLWISSLERKQWAVPKGNASSSCLWALGRCVLAVYAGHSTGAWQSPQLRYRLVCEHLCAFIKVFIGDLAHYWGQSSRQREPHHCGCSPAPAPKGAGSPASLLRA